MLVAWPAMRSSCLTAEKRCKPRSTFSGNSRMKRLNVSEKGLDKLRFIEELIIPAYQQSIATHLMRSKIPARIFGRGWREMSEFVSIAAGPISSRQELHQALSTSCALIHLWPGDHPHPIDTAGPPVIRLNSQGISALIADARLAMAGKLIKPAPLAADSSKATIARILGLRIQNKGTLVGRVMREAQGMSDRAPVVASPFGDGTIAAGATQHGAARQGENSG